MKVIIYLILSFLLLLSTGCGAEINENKNDEFIKDIKVEDFEDNKKDIEKYQRSIIAFDTAVDIVIYSESKEEAYTILEEAEKLAYYYDDILNKSKDTSLISKLNMNKIHELNGTKEDEILLKLINEAIKYSELTNGRFDVTISPLVELWGIGDGNNTSPSYVDIENTIKLIDYNNITVSENYIKLEENTTIDLGAIGKGFIADELKEFLIGVGVKSGLLNFGGNVLTIKKKPDNTNYVIGVREPFENTQDIMGTLEVEDKSIVTSGIYERYFVENDVIYHHILDPETGYPSDNNLLSVTVVSDTSIDGDAFSTATFLLGLEAGLELINDIEGIEAMFITKDNEYFYSNGFVDNYNFNIMN